MSTPRYHFFLGGRDLEMVEIAAVLAEAGAPFDDRGLAWGARYSNYASAMSAASACGEIPVSVELTDDMPRDWPLRPQVRIVDHHGPLAGADRPTSLEQVIRLLGSETEAMTWWQRLVSANDRDHVAGLREIGATPEDIVAVRAADRHAQGVTAGHEAIALEAIGRRRLHGRLTVVEADLRSSTAVADLILPELGGPGADRLLIVLPDALAVYGDGRFILALTKAFDGSWWGGALPLRGFWGMRLDNSAHLAAVEALSDRIA